MDSTTDMNQAVTAMQKKAMEVLSYFDPDSVLEKRYLLKPDAPLWVRQLMQLAHGPLMPDDIRFRFIYEALETIAGGDPFGPEPDWLTSDLLNWAASSVYRVGYCDEVLGYYDDMDDGDVQPRATRKKTKARDDTPHNLWAVLTQAQWLERLEVMETLCEWLPKI